MFIENTNDMAKIAIDRSLLKEYKTREDSRVVYMNDGDEFQIQLFNPEQFTIGAEIYINGKKISNRILAIYPGQRCWLERYLDENVKFKFATYNVDNPDEDSSVAKAIANNGKIEIRFYKEMPCPDTNSGTIWTTNPIINWDTKWNSSDNFLNTAPKLSLSSVTSADVQINSICGCAEYAANAVNTSAVNSASKSFSTPTIKKLSKTVETGRVSKGSYSSQKMEDVNILFSSLPFKSETIKILPTSRKPYTLSDIQKIYCTNCGRKLNTKYKFCPYCGTKCIQL